jgi:hypothetical protein
MSNTRFYFTRKRGDICRASVNKLLLGKYITRGNINYNMTNYQPETQADRGAREKEKRKENRPSIHKIDWLFAPYLIKGDN